MNRNNRLISFFLFLSFFLSAPTVYAKITCESFIKNCPHSKQKCVDISDRFCSGREKAETLYDKYHKGPILIKDGAETVTTNLKSKINQKKHPSVKAQQISNTSPNLKVSKENKKLSYSYIKKAHLRMRLKDYHGAVKYTTKAIEHHPKSKEGYRIRIIASNEIRNFDQVIKDCDIYLNLDNEDALIYAVRAFALLNKGMIEESIKNADFAIYSNANLAFAYFVKANAFLTLKKYYPALENIYIAAKLDREYRDDFNDFYTKYSKYASDFEYKGDLKQITTKSEVQKTKNAAVILFMVLIISTLVGIVLLIVKSSKKKGLPDFIRRQYKVEKKIGEGGMGIVYKGFDTVLKRPVAIKQLRTDFSINKDIREQMLSEARLVASLKHPNILEIYTVFEEKSNLYLIFEYLEGQTLQEKLTIEGSISLEKAKPIFNSICSALDYAHANNIIHRDLKPANIMISDDGAVKVMDFGIAKQIDNNLIKTSSGTPAYMPPEQNKGVMRKESDIYALGICLYETLTGRIPWNMENYDPKINKIIPPSEIVEELPKEIDKLIETAITEDLDKRLSSVTQFCKILNSIRN